jgi:hypothetical protein
MLVLQKESKMKEKEFLEVVNKNSEKIAVSNSKSEDLEQKYIIYYIQSIFT